MQFVRLTIVISGIKDKVEDVVNRGYQNAKRSFSAALKNQDGEMLLRAFSFLSPFRHKPTPQPTRASEL